MLLFSLQNLKAQYAHGGVLGLVFEHYVDSLELRADSSVYKNTFGQTFTITNFKYYLSNVSLLKKGRVVYHSADHFLIIEDEGNSKKIMLNDIPEGEYDALSFMIGVDSAHNSNGANSGALDPINGMYWTWNSGYIFMKIEGRAAASKRPGNIFEYHIGGYKAPANCIRTVTLSPAAPVVIENKKTFALTIRANIAEVLRSPVSIDFSTLPSVTDHSNAEMIADNYIDMFFINEVKHAE